MSDMGDGDLKQRFAGLRQAEAPQAPRWSQRWLENRAQRPALVPPPALRWAMAAIVIVCGALWLMPRAETKARLADLPPLLDPPPGRLFADIAPPSTDFLLPSHLNIHIP